MPTMLIQPGEPCKLFDADAVAAPVNSATFAMPTTLAKVLIWVYKFASAPGSCDIQLQISEDGVFWSTLDTGTATTGENRTTAVTAANFIRARKNAQSGGGALTVEVTMSY